MISSSNHRGVEKWDRAEKKANTGCFVLKHTYPCGQLAHNSAGDMLGGRGTRDLGYLFISHDRSRASLGWVLIFQCFRLQWWQKKSPGTESQGLAVKRQRACMEMVDVKKARGGHPSFHFTSQLISQKSSMLSLSPLLHIENIYNIFMTELMSAIFPKSCLSALSHTDSFLLSATCSLIIIFLIAFPLAQTQRKLF